MHLCTTFILLLILPKCFAISVIQSRAGFALKSRECNQAVVKHTKLPNHAYRVECLCGSNKNIEEVKSTILLLSALYYYILFGRRNNPQYLPCLFSRSNQLSYRFYLGF